MDSPAGKAIGGLIHRLAVSRGAGEHKDEAKEKGKENDADEKVETGFLQVPLNALQEAATSGLQTPTSTIVSAVYEVLMPLSA